MRIAIACEGVRVIVEAEKMVLDSGNLCLYDSENCYMIADLRKDDIEMTFDNTLIHGYADLTHFTAIKAEK